MKTINKRRDRRIVKTTHDKTLLQMERELNALYRQKWTAPSIKLDKPIHNGYVRSLVLRDDITRRSDANDLNVILAELNTKVYCRRADFKARKHGKKKALEDIPHPIYPISIRVWEKLKWPEHFKKYFDYAERIHEHKNGQSCVIKGYWVKSPWMFETKIEKHYLTHYKEVDAALASKIAELERHVWDDEKALARLTKLHGRRGRSADEWNRSERYHNEFLKLIDDQIREFKEPHLNGEHDWN